MTKQLTRSRDDRWIAGVCGGVADYTGIDATVVRLVLVACTILGAGSLIVGYVVAWVLMPGPDRPATVVGTATAVPPTATEPAPRWR
jgi:phage shock protein C